MSRDIEFRQFVDGKYFHYFGFDVAGRSTFSGPASCIKDKHPVSQYTGLLDCNRVKIFEGDIVRYDDVETIETHSGTEYQDFKNVGVISWDSEAAQFVVSGRLGIDDDEFWCDQEKEVIGNICEHSELLEDK